MIWEKEKHKIGEVASFVVFATPPGNSKVAASGKVTCSEIARHYLWLRVSQHISFLSTTIYATCIVAIMPLHHCSTIDNVH
jgi:hypothetical protein